MGGIGRMLNPADDDLARALPAGTLRPSAPAYFEEPRGRLRGVAGIVAAPRTVEQVAQIVRLCAERRVGIVPRGGGTGQGQGDGDEERAATASTGQGRGATATASTGSLAASRRSSASSGATGEGNLKIPQVLLM